MLRSLLLASPALALLACGGGGGGSADAGHLGCLPEDTTYLPVTVLEADGTPAVGAEVNARNTSTGLEVNTTTNAQGTTTAVGQNLGSGTILLKATKGSKTSEVRQATFTCGECSCTFDPTSITLQLRP